MTRLPMLAVSYRALHVWRRNLDVLVRLWKTELWPPFVEPVLQILALGFGLGAYVTSINGLSFIQFLAPGFIASGVMFTAAFECTYASFVRMEFQKTFDAIIATPANVEDVIAGEMFWGAARGVFAAIVVLIVISAFSLVPSALGAVLAVPVAALEGLMFASIAMAFTAIAPAIDTFNYLITLGLTPMFLFSGIYFPLENLSPPLQAAAWFSPLTHAVRPIRALALGAPEPAFWGDLLWMAALTFVLFNVALYLMKRRLVV